MDLISCHAVIGTGEEGNEGGFIPSSICLVHARKHARKHRSLSLIAAASKYPLPVKSVTPSTSNQLAVALSPNRDMAEEDRNTVYQIKPKSTRDAQGTPNCITRQPAAAIHGGD